MAISFNNLRNVNSNGLTCNAYRVTNSGGTFTAIAFSSQDLWADTGMAVGDYLLFRSLNQCNKPRGMRFEVSTAMAGVGITGVWEYRSGASAWTAFAGVTDATNGFQTAGTNLDVTWTVPTDWFTDVTSINSITGALWWRYRITGLTSYTEGGRLGNTTPAVTQLYENAVRVDANHVFDSGTATAGATKTLTDSGKGWTVNALRWRHVYIHTGTGAGQVRVILSNTATAITVFHPWDTNPSTDSQYVITANFDDLYQADVAGTWGVITKAGEHCYSFNCYLNIEAAAFGDCNVMVEFQKDYMWYVSQAPTATYQIHFGWRLPQQYGLDKGIWGNTIVTNRQYSVDERLSGFYGGGSAGSEYIFSAGNRYIQRYDETFTPSTAFVRHWFNFYGKYCINDYFEGWRSVVFPRTGSNKTEVRNLVCQFGHSGLESISGANFDGVKSFNNQSLNLFITGATNYTAQNFTLGPLNYEQNSTIYGSQIQFFAYTGTTTRYINLKPRVRPMLDVYSTTSTGTSYVASTIRALITDEFGNALQNAKMLVSDSLANNNYKFLSFNGTTDYASAANSSAGNQFSGCTAFSVEAWVLCRSTGENAGGRILDKGTGPGAGYVLYNNAGSWSFGVTTGGTFRASNAITASVYGWHHLVGVYDGSTVKLYVNNTTGTAASATGATSNDTGETLYIGNRSANDRTHNGLIRRVRLFKNVALSASDVSTLWDSGDFTQNEACPIAGCTAEYNFTDGSGTTLTDSSITANNATISGATWRDTSTGVTANSVSATTGTSAEFLSAQTVTSGGTYSLSSQPTAGTRLRIVITNYGDAGTSNASTNARMEITGTDQNDTTIKEVVFFDATGNGVYYTENEFKTVISSGLVTAGWYGTMTIDRVGLIYPQQVDLERWVAFDDEVLTPIDFNPFYIKVSAPGFEPETIKKEIREAQNLHIVLKRSVLDIE